MAKDIDIDIKPRMDSSNPSLPLAGELTARNPRDMYRKLPRSQRFKLLIGSLSRSQYYPLGIVIAVFGFLLWVAFPVRLIEQLQLDFRPTNTVDTTISSAERTSMGQGGKNGGSSGTSVFQVRYSLITPNRNDLFLGECFVQYSKGNRKQWPKPGDRIKVRYVAADPSISCIAGGSLLPFGYFGLLLVPVPIALASMIIRHAWARRRAVYLIAHGEYAEGNVNQIVQLKRPFPWTRLGAGHAVDVQLPAGSQISALRFTATDAEVSFLRTSMDTGDPVKLLYDSAAPSRVVLLGFNVTDLAPAT